MASVQRVGCRVKGELGSLELVQERIRASERAGHLVNLTTLELQPTSNEVNPMADDGMAALEPLRKAAGDGDLDFLRGGALDAHPAGSRSRGPCPPQAAPEGTGSRTRTISGPDAAGSETGLRLGLSRTHVLEGSVGVLSRKTRTFSARRSGA
jgi:hypothetical protein